MARSVPTRKDVVKSIAGEILHNYGRGRTLVAVDGRHGAGQQQFAEDLAETLTLQDAKAFCARIDDFFRPRADREREGWLDGVAHYREAYDYSLLRRVLVDPFHTGGSTGFVLTGFDEVRDQPIFQPKWMSAGPDAVLIVEGVFLHRPELARMWNYSIWLDTPTGPSDESAPDQPEKARDFAADEAYLAKVNPGELATVILDNQDPANPIRVFADSC
ncbi:MAG: uridine kinase [Microbacteriaceae bacterium]|nr:uridine kinase [Microbacteriaceae bacterium]